MAKRVTYPTRDVPLNNGSVVHWSERDGARVPITCVVCKKRHRKTACRTLGQGTACRGLHEICYRKIRHQPDAEQIVNLSRPKKLTHEQLLLKGTKVLFQIREPRNSYKVAIECRRCFKEHGRIKYVAYQTINGYIKGLIGVLALIRWEYAGDAILWHHTQHYIKGMKFWDELCTECIHLRGSLPNYFSPRKERSVKVPESAQPLEPWGSIIHWPETRHVYITTERKTVPRWEVPVTCGGCGKRRDCPVRGVTKSDALTDENLSHPKGEKFTGLCRACVSRLLRLETQLPEGSKISPWGINEQGVKVVCGKCATEQTHGVEYPIDFDGLSWGCTNCGHNIGERVHRPSGAKVFWLNLWLKRALGDGTGVKQVPFACAVKGCDRRGVVWPQAVNLKGVVQRKWRGLCDEHLNTVPLPWKITGDFPLIPFRSVVYNSRSQGVGHKRQVLVKCGLQDCTEKNWFNVYSTRRKSFTGYCVTHTFEELVTRSPVPSRNGTEHKDGHRKQGRPETVIIERIREAVKAVAAEWMLVKDNGKTLEQQAARIIQADLLSHLDSIKKKTGTYEQKNKRVSGWFTRWGVQDMFPNVISAFDSFVVTVVAQLRDGVPEEKIVSSLESLLNSARAAA